MAITPITKDELPNSETLAVSDLKEGTGIKFPCRWNHNGKTDQCAGVQNLRNKFRGHNRTDIIKCKDGHVYVWRET